MNFIRLFKRSYLSKTPVVDNKFYLGKRSATPKEISQPNDAVAIIESGSRVFVHGAAACPTTLLQGFLKSIY